ncbi:unnamed protein product [Parnassius mnemosyne]|uniref:DDE Tnp4 domain-containing protein n=2 Tax=Parnassius mnemosyne TaxID=213953 RepID=A0AAV1LBP8_9NEOP
MPAIHDQVYRQVCSALEAASSLQCIHIGHTRSSSPSSLHDAALVETMASLVTDDDALAILGLSLAIKKTKRKDRSMWCKNWLMKRKKLSHINLVKELRIAPKDYRNYVRMNEETYLKLLSMVTPLIQKEDTVMRNAITTHERLLATLRFLASGRSYECLKYSAIISPQALGRIIPETCAAIYKVLQNDYMQFPDTANKWREIAHQFEEIWNFPHCLGAIDGKHVDIIPPADSGSYYYNYKGRHSMVLMAIVDARYRFLLADFGTNGRVSDGGVLQNTKFFQKLQNKKLNIPNPENIEGSSRCLPYVFIGDDAFPLRTDMIKPYRQGDLNTHEKKNF